MAPSRRAITPETLGAWLVKGGPRESAPLLDSGFGTLTHRCVRPGYRLDLVRPGQPVLFWVSGGDPSVPAGLYGHGRTTGTAARVDRDRCPTDPRLDLPVRLGPVAPPVLREELRAHPTLRSIEVLRTPVGSNPSYLTREELAALRAGWPQVDGG